MVYLLSPRSPHGYSLMKLAALLFEWFELLDVFGPLEMLGQIGEELEIVMVSQTIGPIPSAQGPAGCSQQCLVDDASFDVVLIPGGIGTRTEVDNDACINWIATHASKARYIASVCTERRGLL